MAKRKGSVPAVSRQTKIRPIPVKVKVDDDSLSESEKFAAEMAEFEHVLEVTGYYKHIGMLQAGFPFTFMRVKDTDQQAFEVACTALSVPFTYVLRWGQEHSYKIGRKNN